MINLNDLNLPDVVIIAQQGDLYIKSGKTEVLDDVRGLPTPLRVINNGPNTEIISCDGVDHLVLAEHLATTWEGQDYTVQRVYTPNNAYNRKPVSCFTTCKQLTNKLFKLVLEEEWQPKTIQLVIAVDDTEAKQLVYKITNYKSWLGDNVEVINIDLDNIQVIDLGIIGAAVA